MRLPRRIQHRVEEAVRLRVDARLQPVHEQLGSVDQRLAPLEQRLDQLAARTVELAAGVDLNNVSERVDRLDEVTRVVEERLRQLEAQAEWDTHQLSRLSSQAAAFEERLEREARPVVVTEGDGKGVPESRQLVEVIREEHARVRARLAVLSSYEERIRRLENRAFPPPPG